MLQEYVDMEIIVINDDEIDEVAPDVGFEPTTKRLTAAYSTAELIWNIRNLES